MDELTELEYNPDLDDNHTFIHPCKASQSDPENDKTHQNDSKK